MTMEREQESNVDEMEMSLLSSPPTPNEGTIGESLKHGRREDMVRLAMISLYGIFMAGFISWTFVGKALGGSQRVLETGSIPVNQLYSGLALSIVFTPLAILLRNTAARLQTLHPFMVARSKGIRIADLDRLSEGGIKGAMTICGYSLEKGLVQIGFMIAGAVVVPCATLIITIGNDNRIIPSTAVVGLPVLDPSGSVWMASSLHNSMNGYDIESNSTFTTDVADWYKGQLLLGGSAGMIAPYDSYVLSNTPTKNLSLTNGTIHNGILTYHWDAGCQPATEITWNSTVKGTTGYLNISSPDGMKPVSVNFTFNPVYVVWMDRIMYSPFISEISARQHIVAPNATTYYAIAGLTSELYESISPGDGVFIEDDDGIWVSAVKCNATMGYKVSRCEWNGISMVNCTDTPGANTTQLDTDALVQLSNYLNSIPLALAMQQDHILGLDTLATSLTYTFETIGSGKRFRAPTIANFTSMYGLVAPSIVLDISNGYYGTATVPTEETFSYPVYSIRLPWLLTESLFVFVCMILLSYDIISSFLKESPIREMSFIAIAAATRGNWWDKQVDGLCAVPRKEMRRKSTSEPVTFGVDRYNIHHIGLSPRTDRIVWNERYRGAVIH